MEIDGRVAMPRHHRANNHNDMIDEKGRVWLAATVRGVDNPAFCKKGSDHPSAKIFPLEKSTRQAAIGAQTGRKASARRVASGRTA